MKRRLVSRGFKFFSRNLIRFSKNILPAYSEQQTTARSS